MTERESCKTCKYLNEEYKGCDHCHDYSGWAPSATEPDHLPDPGKSITIQAEEICTFHHHAQWVNHASSWIGGFRKEEKIICIDKNGNTLTIGMDFRIAKEKDLFPVKAYRCIRTSEVNK